jgi:hypothetical protein
MLLPATQAAALDLSGYRTRDVIPNVQTVSPDRLLRAIASGRAAELLESRRDHYVVAVRR